MGLSKRHRWSIGAGPGCVYLISEIKYLGLLSERFLYIFRSRTYIIHSMFVIFVADAYNSFAGLAGIIHILKSATKRIVDLNGYACLSMRGLTPWRRTCIVARGAPNFAQSPLAQATMERGLTTPAGSHGARRIRERVPRLLRCTGYLLGRRHEGRWPCLSAALDAALSRPSPALIRKGRLPNIMAARRRTAAELLNASSNA